MLFVILNVPIVLKNFAKSFTTVACKAAFPAECSHCFIKRKLLSMNVHDILLLKRRTHGGLHVN